MMNQIFSIFLIGLCALVFAASGKEFQRFQETLKAGNTFKAGAVKLNGTLPLGVPLAGYNHGARRVPYWPLPYVRDYTTWMEPNVGHLDPSWVKALVIDNGSERFCFITTDTIGSDGSLAELAYGLAVENGFTVKRENVIFSGSHSHSGPGAISPEFLWSIAPATDLLVPKIQRMYAEYVATAMIKAESALEPAKIDIGVGNLVGVTRNRRAPNPWVQPDTIDPHLAVVRVESESGKPIATIWNYAIHGTCYGPSNMKFSSDIMGATCNEIEKDIGGVAMFINADAGDIEPAPETCSCQKDVCTFAGAPKIAAAVKKVYDTLKPTNEVEMSSYSQIVPFGRTQLNITLQRWENCTRGGPLDICSICRVLDCEANIELPESWVEENPRFTAFRFKINGKNTVLVTVPGEALLELGWIVRNDTQKLGYDQTIFAGYSNNHMGYFATPNEYDWGGYESELTFWGIGTAQKIADSAKLVAQKVLGN